MMKLENVDKYYNINTSSEVHALKNINLSIEKGEMVAIMGVPAPASQRLYISSAVLTSRHTESTFSGNMRFPSTAIMTLR